MMPNARRGGYATLLLLLLIAGNVQAATLTINATEDATVAQALPTTNAGTDKELAVGTGGTGLSLRFYLNFSNLTELHGKVITDAKINLTVNKSGSGGHAEKIDMYRLFNTSWSENTTTWNNQPNTNNTNHTSDLYVWNSTDYRTTNYALFDARQAIGYAAARNETSIGFIFIRNTTAVNRVTYFHSLNNISQAQIPRLEVTYIDPSDYTININASDLKGNKFEMGLSYYYTNGTGDQDNITTALRDIGGGVLLKTVSWRLWESSNSTPTNISTQNWTGFDWDNDREDEYYNGEWHNSTWDGFLAAAKNVNPSNPPVLIIRLIRPPDWIKAAGIDTGKWYPFKAYSYNDKKYAFKMAMLYATQNASYPADKLIINPINEPYGNTDTAISTYSNRLEDYGDTMMAAYDAAMEVNSSIRIIGLDDNDPNGYLTRDLFLQNSSYAKHFTAGLSYHNYLHGDNGFTAWNSDGSRKYPCDTCPWNPYGREWELLYQTYQEDMMWNLLNNASYNFSIKKVWETEYDDKYLAYNDPSGNNDTKIFNNTNDALWFGAKWTINSQQRKNITLPWILQPIQNVNGYDVGNTIDLGWGFMDSFQNNWKKYEAYNVSKTYNTFANGSDIVNLSNTTLYDNYIFVGSFKNNKRSNIFITNYRNTSSNISLNITNLDFQVNTRKVYTLFNGTKTEDTAFSSTVFSYTLQPNASIMIELSDNRTFNITCPAGWCYLAMNYSNKTLLQIDNLLSNDTVHGWYNATSQKHEQHRTGYVPYQSANVTRRQGYYVYFKRPTTVSVEISTAPAITLRAGWNLVGNLGASAKTLSVLKTEIGANATAAEYFNKTTQARQTADSASVPAGEAFFVYVSQNTEWS